MVLPGRTSCVRKRLVYLDRGSGFARTNLECSALFSHTFLHPSQTHSNVCPILQKMVQRRARYSRAVVAYAKHGSVFHDAQRNVRA